MKVQRHISMGEEEKKPEAAVEEAPKAKKPAEDAKDEKKLKAEKQPPPQEIVLKVYMHCEGCATKVRRCLKGFNGVENVTTDCKTSKVVVKGEKADPLKIVARLQRKSHRQIHLISPIPPPPPPSEEAKEAPNVEENNVEPPVITVVLGVYMHCGACAQELEKRIKRMKGVDSVEADLKSSQVAVKGALEAEKLKDYILKRTGKHVSIIKVESEEKPKEATAEKKKKKKKKKNPDEEVAKEGKKEKGGNGKEKKEGGEAAAAKAEAEAGDSKAEPKKNEVHYYYPHYQQQQVYPQRFIHEYPSPQMFSDENPNACSVM